MTDKADPEMARACNPNPCQNGGYCSSAIDWDKGGKSCKVACKCKNGFGGLRCEIRAYILLPVPPTFSDFRL